MMMMKMMLLKAMCLRVRGDGVKFSICCFVVVCCSGVKFPICSFWFSGLMRILLDLPRGREGTGTVL